MTLSLGAMAMKEYYAFPKAPVLLESHHNSFSAIFKDSLWWGSYPSADKQSVYSTLKGKDIVQKK